MSKDRREVLVSAEALGRRVKTWDFSFRLQDIIVRKLEYSVGGKFDTIKVGIFHGIKVVMWY